MSFHRSNTFHAVRAFPTIIRGLGDLLGKSKSSSSKGKAALLMILLVVIAVTGGILVTRCIILSTAEAYAATIVADVERANARRTATG